MQQATLRVRTADRLVVMTGTILQSGTKIGLNDWFQKRNGEWAKCPPRVAGITLPSGIVTVWIRPVKVKTVSKKSD